MNLLFCMNRDVLGIFVCCLKSIVTHGGYDHYDIYVLHSFFDESMERALSQDFREKISFHFIRVDPEQFADFPQTGRYPLEIYYRLAAPHLLPDDLSRILYLDVDTVVLNSLQGLYETDFEGNYYVGCTHTRDFLTQVNRIRLKSNSDAVYINTGVLLMNLPALRENLSMEDICNYVQKHAHALLLPDQDILMGLYGDKVKLAETLRFNLSDRIMTIYNKEHRHHKIDLEWVRRNTSIVHYCGHNKPWKDDYSGELGVFYQELLVH